MRLIETDKKVINYEFLLEVRCLWILDWLERDQNCEVDQTAEKTSTNSKLCVFTDSLQRLCSRMPIEIGEHAHQPLR
jgi:hypothetical protein